MRRGPGGDEEGTSPFFEEGRGGERRGEEGMRRGWGGENEKK